MCTLHIQVRTSFHSTQCAAIGERIVSPARFLPLRAHSISSREASKQARVRAHREAVPQNSPVYRALQACRGTICSWKAIDAPQGRPSSVCMVCGAPALGDVNTIDQASASSQPVLRPPTEGCGNYLSLLPCMPALRCGATVGAFAGCCLQRAHVRHDGSPSPVIVHDLPHPRE
ncbi:hypothetical protein PsYK624_052190 [Phanerochaete sordida]|uniref:Uncharacterized protein n=1 Tax=Phanerochaete sordida TaxID=48140 RepID=A0A9P3LBE6_9APHY|nr:hypothetical protein PsYK624_052190 [Phanerochaete sordida]